MDEQSIFIEAIEKAEGNERTEFLEQACNGDDHLRRRVNRLLALNSRSEFLDRPVHRADELASMVVAEDERIGPYEVLEQLGEGGMGIVYRARQIEPVEREVALKVIKPGMDSEQVIARFEAERQALAMMNHPNIAGVIDAGSTESGRPYFVMEYVPGAAITDFCDEHQLNTDDRIELFLSVCRAVHHAHQKGIIHRDIKPSNILVSLQDDGPVIKVIDFGVAKAIHSDSPVRVWETGIQQIVGTPLYMSPEQARSSGKDIDTRTDIYSLGVVLYELLSGATPFAESTLRDSDQDEMRRIICDEDPPRPSARLSSLQEKASTISENRCLTPRRLINKLKGDLDWIVVKAMEKDRERRYESASELALDLSRFVKGAAVHARKPSATYLFRKFIRRHRVGVFLTAFLVAVLCTTAATSTYFAVDASRARARAESEADIARRVRSFLESDILSYVGPERESTVDVKLRDVIDLAGEKIGKRFGKEPLVEAAIHETFGRTYEEIGNRRKAIKHFERSYKIRRQHQEVGNTQVANAAYYLTTNYNHFGREDDSIAVHKQLISDLGNQYGNDSIKTVKPTTWLGFAYQSKGQRELAKPLLEKAHRLRRQHYGRFDVETSSRINHLPILYTEMGLYREAETLFEESLLVRKTVHGETSSSYAATLFHCAELAMARGQLNKADEILAKAISIRLANEKAGKHKTAMYVMRRGQIHEKQGDVEKAETNYVRALSMLRESVGPQHNFLVSCTRRLSRIYMRAGEYHKAIPILRDTLPTDGTVLIETYAARRCVFHLISSYTAVGLNPQATVLLMRTLEKGDLIPQSDVGRLSTIALELTEALARVGSTKESRELLQRLLEFQTKRLGKEHPDTICTMDRLADALERIGQSQKALALRKVEWPIVKKGSWPPEAKIRCGVALAEGLERAGKTPDAVDALEEVHRIGTVNECHVPELYRGQRLLCEARVRQGLLQDAEALMLESWQHSLSCDKSYAKEAQSRIREFGHSYYLKHRGADEAQLWKQRCQLSIEKLVGK